MEPSAIPIDDGARDVDEATGDFSSAINTLVVGERGERLRPIRTRPGIRAASVFPYTSEQVWAGLTPAPVTAIGRIGTSIMYVTDDGAGTRYVWELTPSTLLFQGDFTAATNIDGPLPVTFATGRDVIIASAGGRPWRLAPGTLPSPLAGNPPYSASATFIAQRLVIVPPGVTGYFFWSDLGPSGITTWDLAFEFREAEARPDALVACESTSGELYMFGETTTQLFVPDADETFAPGPVLETGCLARRSVVRHDRGAAWFDNRKRFNLSDLRSEVILSDRGIGRTIGALTNYTDIWGFRCRIGSHDLLVFVCPTDGRTFALDLIADVWTEWRRWADGRWQPWAPTAYFWDQVTNTHIVGMPDGTLRELSLDAYTDMEDDLRWEVRTAFRGGAGKRHAIEAQFPFHPGTAATATAGVDVSWRDGLGPFVPPIRIALGTPGDAETVGIISPVGEPYRRRQWALSGAANAAYFLAPGKELVEEVDF